MNEDIVKRLREGTFGTDETKTDNVINGHMTRAAAEIEKLRKENAELLATCQGWANTVSEFTRKRDEALERADAAIEALRVAQEALNNGGFISDKNRAAIDAVLKQGESE